MSDSPPQSIKLSAAMQQRLLSQLSDGKLLECKGCEALYPPTNGKDGMCSVCVEQEQKTKEDKKASSKVKVNRSKCANTEECQRPALKKSIYCSPYCGGRIWRARNRAKKKADVAAAIKAAEEKAKEETIKEKETPPEVVTPIPLAEDVREFLGDNPPPKDLKGLTSLLTSLEENLESHKSDLIERVGQKVPATEATEEEEDVILLKGQYIGSEGQNCHMPDCNGMLQRKFNRDTKQAFYGCTKYWRNNRKPSELLCKATAMHPSEQQETITQSDLANKTISILNALNSSLVEFRMLRSEVSECRAELKAVNRQLEINNKTISGASKTVDNIDSRTEDTRKSVERLSKEWGA